ncbi:MAG: STN domain-containing protein, partial [Muribaculaceae bacterium]|nr:STN domain-containing protein [Muribaculaceae bacterium]
MKRRSITAAAVIAAAITLQAQNVTLTAKNKDAEKVFAELIHQTGKNFIYPSGLLDGMKVTVNANNTPLTQVLDNMFSGTGVTYKIKGNNVTLKREKIKSVTK